MFLKKIRASQVTKEGIIVLACAGVLFLLLESRFAASKAGLWSPQNGELIAICGSLILYWFMALPVVGPEDVRNRYWLINETTGKATRAPWGLYFRSLDGWFRRKGQVLIRIPFGDMICILNEELEIGVKILISRTDPDEYRTELLYKLCCELDAMQPNPGREEIERALVPYSGMAALYAPRKRTSE